MLCERNGLVLGRFECFVANVVECVVERWLLLPGERVGLHATIPSELYFDDAVLPFLGAVIVGDRPEPIYSKYYC